MIVFTINETNHTQYMSHTHYYQEDTDEGLKIAALLNQLIESPGALSKKEWDYLNTLPIGTLMREAGISRKEAVHVFNQIDRIEADVSRIGRFEHLTDAFMMWLVGGSFVLAGVLLALISIPESVWGRITISVSIGIGLIFIFVPFIARKRALTYDKDCFRHAIVRNPQGKGLMKRSVLTTDALNSRISAPRAEESFVGSCTKKFAQTQNRKISKYEEICLIKQLLDGYNLKISDLPFEVIEEIDGICPVENRMKEVIESTNLEKQLTRHHEGDSDYTQGTGSSKKVLIASVCLTLGYAVIQVIGGFLSNSLALLSDAGHMVTDSASLFFALLANVLAGRPASGKYSFGFAKLEVLAALLNALAMFAVVLWIVVGVVSAARNRSTVLASFWLPRSGC